MSSHKKRCIDNYKKTPKTLTVATIVDSAREHRKYEDTPLYKVRLKKDSRSWFEKLDLITSDSDQSPWTNSYKNKTVATIKNYDGHCEVTFANNVSINLSLSDLYDLNTALNAFNHLSEGNITYKKKIIKVKKKDI